MKLERFGEAAASYREASEINPAATSLQLEAEYAEALQKDVDEDAMTQQQQLQQQQQQQQEDQKHQQVEQLLMLIQ